VSFVAVDDFGHVVNPMIVEGQVHGGIAQGIGQALLEHGVYDETGQLVTGSYMDYCMPRADDLPSFRVDTTVTPCTHNPLGVKGCARPVRSVRRRGHECGHGRARRARRRDAGNTERVWRALRGN